MTEPSSTIADLTRTVIREKISAMQARERELTERAALLFQRNGLARPKATISHRDRSTHNRARALLNGAHGLLAPIEDDGGETELDVLAERDAVRLALSVLGRADLEKRAIEVAEQAIELTPKWQALQREWILAAVRFEAMEARCRAFKESAGGDVCAALSNEGLPAGNGAEIDMRIMNQSFPGSVLDYTSTAQDVARVAVARGIVSQAEVERAKRGKEA